MTKDSRKDLLVFIRDRERFPSFASLTIPVEFLRPCTCVTGKVRRLPWPRYILIGGRQRHRSRDEPDGHRFQLPPVRIGRVSPANSRNLSAIESRNRPTGVPTDPTIDIPTFEDPIRRSFVASRASMPLRRVANTISRNSLDGVRAARILIDDISAGTLHFLTNSSGGMEIRAGRIV